MATELNSVQRDMSQDIEDLTTRYTKRRKEILEGQRQDLDELNQNYEKQKGEIQKNHEAAINHIQKDQSDRMQSIRSENDNVYKNSRETNAKLMENLRKNYEDSRKVNETQIKSAEQQASDRLKEVNVREEESIKRLHDEMQKESQARLAQSQEARTKARNELDQLIAKGNTAKSEVQHKNEDKLKEINEHYSIEEERTRGLRQQALDNVRTETQDTMERQKQFAAAHLEQEKLVESKNIDKLHHSYKAEAEHTKALGDHELESMRKQNLQAAAIEDEKGKKRIESIEVGNEKRIQSETKVGNQRVAEEKDKTIRQIHASQEHLKRSTEKERLIEESRLHDLEKNYHQQYEKNSQVFQENLKRQIDQYRSKFAGNDANFKDSFMMQKQLYEKQIGAAKRLSEQSAEFYADRREDPFYSIHNQGSRLHETSDSYILETHIAPHEKDAIKVKIDKDKAVVAGTRAYKDEVKDDNKKLRTANFQTFHEEIAFDKPVSTIGIIEERDHDRVLYKIPKLAYFKNSKT
jgi:hypothetical protein